MKVLIGVFCFLAIAGSGFWIMRQVDSFLKKPSFGRQGHSSGPAR